MLIPDEVRKCVCFVCCKVGPEDSPAPIGTAFLIGLSIADNSSMVYLVTAKHVLDDVKRYSLDKKAYVRINLKDKGAILIESDVTDWVFHPTDATVDVAVALIALDDLPFDARFLQIENTATDEVIKSNSIGHGDEVFVVGLFTNHFGRNANVPIVRIGNIASMSDEPVATKWANGPMAAYLIEARSIGGLSGSPVFVHLGPINIDANRTVTFAGHRGGSLYLLGLIHGHWNLPPEALKENTRPDSSLDDTMGADLVNSGIAIVVPISKIIEVLNQPRLKNDRDREAKRLQDRSIQAAVTDSATQS